MVLRWVATEGSLAAPVVGFIIYTVTTSTVCGDALATTGADIAAPRATLRNLSEDIGPYVSRDPDLSVT